MTGAFLTVVASQVLAIARTAVADDTGTGTEASKFGDRLAALEELHDDTHPDHHRQGSP